MSAAGAAAGLERPPLPAPQTRLVWARPRLPEGARDEVLEELSGGRPVAEEAADEAGRAEGSCAAPAGGDAAQRSAACSSSGRPLWESHEVQELTLLQVGRGGVRVARERGV